MLYAAIATRAFHRYATYRSATLAGIFTNSVFGVIYSFAYLALWAQDPDAGGYDAVDAVTFVWLTQALLMTMAIWGGGTTDDLAVRTLVGRFVQFPVRRRTVRSARLAPSFTGLDRDSFVSQRGLLHGILTDGSRSDLDRFVEAVTATCLGRSPQVVGEAPCAA